MGLSTHVLNTMHGTPAAGMRGALYSINGVNTTLIKEFVLDQEGRNPGGLLLDSTHFQVGSYRLAFDVAAYFKLLGVLLPDPPFLNIVNLDFGVANIAAHYHVPLLVSPWSYSTYRGS